MAQHLEDILGDKLLTSTIGDSVVTQLPSPEVITSWVFLYMMEKKNSFLTSAHSSFSFNSSEIAYLLSEWT